MKSKLSTLFLLLFVGSILSLSGDTFKSDQKKYKRVRQAYLYKEKSIDKVLLNHGIDKNKLVIYLRIFKEEGVLELWGKDISSKRYELLKEFTVCEKSGTIGPKRKQGDYQVPEGFYHINVFNPYSNFYLSLGINYPNTSDRILGYKPRLGGDIYIHGDCVTIGCVPLTNDKIKELYIYCVEAKNNGQKTIPVTIFPTKLSTKKMEELKQTYKSKTNTLNLWEDLKDGYDYFNLTNRLPNVVFLKNGRHKVG